MGGKRFLFVLGILAVFGSGVLLGSFATSALGQGGGHKEVQGIRLYGYIDESATTRGAIGLKPGLSAGYAIRVDYQTPTEIGVVAVKR